MGNKWAMDFFLSFLAIFLFLVYCKILATKKS